MNAHDVISAIYYLVHVNAGCDTTMPADRMSTSSSFLIVLTYFTVYLAPARPTAHVKKSEACSQRRSRSKSGTLAIEPELKQDAKAELLIEEPKVSPKHHAEEDVRRVARMSSRLDSSVLGMLTLGLVGRSLRLQPVPWRPEFSIGCPFSSQQLYDLSPSFNASLLTPE